MLAQEKEKKRLIGVCVCVICGQRVVISKRSTNSETAAVKEKERSVIYADTHTFHLVPYGKMMKAMVQIESTTGVGSDPDIVLQKHASTGNSSSYCRTNSSSLSSSGFCSSGLIIASSSISDSSSPAFQSNNNSSQQASGTGVASVPPVFPSVRTSTTTNTTHHLVRSMKSDNSTASSRQEMMDNSVSHSDSTEFDMPFGIDDDDLVNYQPPVIFSSRAGSMKCLNKRISSKSFELEAFEEEDLNLQENLPNKGFDSLCNFIRYVYVYFSLVCSLFIPVSRT